MALSPRKPAKKPAAAEASLTDRAYSDIEALIVTLRLAPGSAVSEAVLSKRLGIGRTPIREALQRLVREPLVARSADAAGAASDRLLGYIERLTRDTVSAGN